MRFDLGIFCDYLLPMKMGKAKVLEKQFVGIREGKITEIQPWKSNLRHHCKKFIDAKNQVVLPGLVNTHTHLPMTLFRGLEDDVPFHVWLFEKILPSERKFVTEKFVEVGTELAAVESIRFGVTTVCDMYFFAEAVAKVWDRFGLRGLISQVFTNEVTPEDKKIDAEKNFLTLREQYDRHDRIEIILGPHAPYTCTDQLLKEVVALAEKSAAPITIHLAETAFELENSIQQYNQSPVERLYKLGVLEQNTICAHMIHLQENDYFLVKKAGARVAHNPDSNAKLGSGVADIPKFLQIGIPVGLGTDGVASNNNLSILGAMDLATKMQKLTKKNNTAMTAEDALCAATLGGAKVLSLENEIGSIEKGKKADLIFVDVNVPHLQPITPASIPSYLVYSACGMEVDTVVCNGKILMEKKKIKQVNEKEIFSKAQKIRIEMEKFLKSPKGKK